MVSRVQLVGVAAVQLQSTHIVPACFTVAQLAVIGYIVPEVFRFPFDIAPGLACADVPNGVAAIDAIPSLGWAQMFFAIGATDYYGFLGDFDAGKLDLDPEVAETRKLQELQRKSW